MIYEAILHACVVTMLFVRNNNGCRIFFDNRCLI